MDRLHLATRRRLAGAPATLRPGVVNYELPQVKPAVYGATHGLTTKEDTRRWLEGAARLLPDDDPRARLKMLRRPWNDIGLRAMASEMLVVRVDLDPPA